jgi:hypothetical protein
LDTQERDFQRRHRLRPASAGTSFPVAVPWPSTVYQRIGRTELVLVAQPPTLSLDELRAVVAICVEHALSVNVVDGPHGHALMFTKH